MRSFFNCTKATQHVDPASQAQAVPEPLTRVQIENMLTEYVRDGSPSENRMEAKTRILACFDAIQAALTATELPAVQEPHNDISRPKFELALDKLQLKELPESLLFLEGIDSLKLSENQLEMLPDSIGSFSKLKFLLADKNKLQNLPESIGNLSSLEILWIGGNQLQRLPESIGNLSNLSLLDMGQNNIQTLPESIGNLSKLTSLDLTNNAIRSVPQSIGQLSRLVTLYFGNSQFENEVAHQQLSASLNSAPLSAPIAFAAYCEQHSNQLETLPESIGNLQQLNVLELGGNPLRELPHGLVRLLTSCHVDLTHTSLPQTVREQVQNAIQVHHAQNPDQGPHIQFDMAQHNQVIQVKPLREEMDSWREQLGSSSSAETAEQDQAFQAALGELSDVEENALSGQLARMRVTAHYKAAPQDLIQRVNNFLNYVEQAPDVLKTCAAIASEGTVTCDDRIALAFIELEEAIVHHQSLSEPSMAKLVETASGLHKSQLLKDIAQKKVSTLVGFVDPTEIILKYIVNLSKEFKLPSQLNDMIFHNCALQVSKSDIEQARQQIKAQSSDADLNTYLASWQPWKQALQTQYPEQYTNLQNKVSERQASLYEQMEGLSEQLGDAKTTHGERSDQYLTLLTQSNGLHTDYRNIETNLLVQLTEQARRNMGH